MFERILVPLDGYLRSEQALTYALQIARRFDSQVVLLRVLVPTPLTSTAVGGLGNLRAGEVMLEQARRRDRSAMARASRYLKGKFEEVGLSNRNGSWQVALGAPADAILDYCQRADVDLIVMTSHSRGRLRRAFTQSVADQVIREVGIPVLVFQPKTRV